MYARLKKAATGIVVVLGIFVGMFAATAPAQAYVSGCTTGFSSVGAYAQCGFSSSGYYKVRVLCTNPFTGSSYFAYGPRKSTSSSSPSVATCNT